MTRLTEQEIKFIKDTGFTPTVYQCNEYDKIGKPYYELDALAKNKYDIDFLKLTEKITDSTNCDCISLEYEATYLLYSFFTKEELQSLTSQEALNWLRDFKYYFGFRKWDEELVRIEIEEAIEVHDGIRELYEDEDGEIWNRLKEELTNDK